MRTKRPLKRDFSQTQANCTMNIYLCLHINTMISFSKNMSNHNLGYHSKDMLYFINDIAKFMDGNICGFGQPYNLKQV